MNILAAGDTAYIIVGVAVPFFGFCGLLASVLISSKRNRNRIDEVHEEIRSPNGTSTGKLNYENRKMLIEVREQMVEIREAQINGWKRAAEDSVRAEADRERLEMKVDSIATIQEEHINRDEVRFRMLFEASGIPDPHQV